MFSGRLKVKETDYSNYYSKKFSRIYAVRESGDSAVADRVRSILRDTPFEIVDSKRDVPPEHRTGETLFLDHQTGKMVDRCPGTKGHVCCNYLTVNLYAGCAIGCTYCIMRWYLDFEPITVYTNPSRGIGEINSIAEANREKMVRVGTGEVGDSLLYDPLCDLSREFIEALAPYENVFFELKTKTDFIDHLLNIQEKGNTVIAFSLNPQVLIDAEEPGAALLKERLSAASAAAEAGFSLAFHFDPIIWGPAVEGAYLAAAAALGAFPKEKIVWISMGTVRYPGELKERMGSRPYLYDEFVKCRDGKFRYLQVRRIEIYRKMAGTMRNAGVSAPIYLCMESGTVWDKVFGSLPKGLPGTGSIFSPSVIPE